MAKTRSAQSKSFTQKRRRRAIIGVVSAIVAAASWAFVFSSVTYLPAFEITDVTVYGIDAELVPALTGAATDAMSGAYLGVFSRANAFIYPEKRIAQAIASSSPRVEHVVIKRNGLKHLDISVTEKAPDAIVCADLPDFVDREVVWTEKCYLSDARGYIFRPIKEHEFAAGTKLYMPDLTGKDISGSFATSTDRFKQIQRLIRAIRNSGINIRATMTEGSEIELYADNPSGDSVVVIKMNDRVSLDEQRENLIAFWAKMTADARAQKKTLEWSEIKLQFPPNVYSR